MTTLSRRIEAILFTRDEAVSEALLAQALDVSEDAVREALAAGDMAAAASLLGRPYAISGHVVHGRKLGRALAESAPGRQDGFRTLNLRFSRRACAWQPAASGIFAVRVSGLGSAPLPGVANLGVRPSLDAHDINGGRVLLLLQEKGLIKIKPGTGLTPSPLDVVENPKKFKFVELDAAQLARSLADLDAASVPTNYALPAGLDPKKQALALEKADTPYTGVLAVREQDKNQPWVQALIKSYQSAPVRDFINEHFKGALLPAF